MFVYTHWYGNGTQTVQAFNKVEKAVEFTWQQIESYISVPGKRKPRSYHFFDSPKEEKEEEETIPELVVLKIQLEKVKQKPSFENALLLIELYEDYNNHVLGQESALHTLKNIQVLE